MNDGERNAKEATGYTGCHRETIYRKVRKKEIPHWHIGHEIRFSKTSIDEWIKKQKVLSISREIKA
ncbi:MAG: Helix-turn-helix domain [Neobacillus sp.]|nr:Helix-turn-helix domain [Neobacillus sp.]